MKILIDITPAELAEVLKNFMSETPPNEQTFKAWFPGNYAENLAAAHDDFLSVQKNNRPKAV